MIDFIEGFTILILVIPVTIGIITNFSVKRINGYKLWQEILFCIYPIIVFSLFFIILIGLLCLIMGRQLTILN